MWIDRLLNASIVKACETRPVVLLTGARQTGKSSLLQRMFPHAEYVTLDRVVMAEEAEANPSQFLDRFDGPVILDEVQYAPNLFRELKIRVDMQRGDYGRWILTGSQRLQLMREVSESLAGRIHIAQLESLSAKELRNSRQFSDKQIEASLWNGGYPEIWANSSLTPAIYYEDYIQSYLERDLKALIKVGNLRDFRRFIMICATRSGKLLNYTDMAKDLAVSATTVKSWLAALEASGIIYLLPPYFANIGKRLVKVPKLYFADNGLLGHLLNIADAPSYARSPMKGNMWENFIFTEILKTTGAVPGRSLFFYRDQNGVEMDFLVERGGCLYLVEAKSAERPDSRKLNFSKIEKLFPEMNVRNILLCTTSESSPVHLRDFRLMNPLLHDLDQLFS